MFEDEKNGLLVESRNVEALAASLRRLLDDETLRRRLGRGGGGSAARFTPQYVMQDWDQVIRAALASRGNAALTSRGNAALTSRGNEELSPC